MNKLAYTVSLLVTAGALSSLAGCELYFGDHGDNNNTDTWNYCGSDGQYQCQGDSCEWVSSTCTDSGTGSGTTMGSGGGSGYECTGNTDCAAGCYCSGGTCTEGGFCSTDADCGTGYHCDTQRSSCEPNPQGYCNADTDCNQAGGQFCDTTNHTCSQGSCAGAITCTTAKPTCPVGSSPLIYNGCYTGACFETDMCSEAPVCQNVNDENDCLNRTTDCAPTYTGLNCTKTDGTACHSGDSGCTCESFVFATCDDRVPN